MEHDTLKCPKCGSGCYVWIEGDITTALVEPTIKEFLVYCLNDCGVVGNIEGKIILNKKTLNMERWYLVNS